MAFVYVFQDNFVTAIAWLLKRVDVDEVCVDGT